MRLNRAPDVRYAICTMQYAPDLPSHSDMPQSQHLPFAHQARSPPSSLPSRTRRARVAVIGAGVAGAACAQALVTQGRNLLSIDVFEAGPECYTEPLSISAHPYTLHPTPAGTGVGLVCEHLRHGDTLNPQPETRPPDPNLNLKRNPQTLNANADARGAGGKVKGLHNKFGDDVEVGVCPFFSAVAPTFRAQVWRHVCATARVQVCVYNRRCAGMCQVGQVGSG